MPTPGHPIEVFLAFLRLGLTSFGGPVAHLAHFRRDLVHGRGWISEADYASLVGLAQVLPGPTSSQVGVLMGWRRAGPWGALAAWTAFTLPSALLLAGAAAIALQQGPGPWLAGLLAAVVAVVAVAVQGMARSLCPDLPRLLIAGGVALVCGIAPGPWTPLVALGLAAVAGLGLPRPPTPPLAAGTGLPSRRQAVVLLALAVVLGGVTWWPWDHPWAVVTRTCVTAGGLVMGGGHVVLPLLRDPLVGAGVLDDGRFLAGYGLAQAVPGPLFTVAAWIGMVVGGPLLAVLAVVAIFTPGVLLALGAVRFHQDLLARPRLAAASLGIQAGVVGLLAAAWGRTIVPEGVTSPLTALLAVAATVVLIHGRVPVGIIVLGCAGITALGG